MGKDKFLNYQDLFPLHEHIQVQNAADDNFKKVLQISSQ